MTSRRFSALAWCCYAVGATRLGDELLLISIFGWRATRGLNGPKRARP